MAPKHYFLSGIGGSGMLPLALILKGQGHRVSGSDRGRDQGRDLKKFQDLENKGIQLFPQDGSGVRDVDALVVSAAVENTVPDVKAALEAGIPIIKRAELLAEIFNAFPNRIAVGGTSGKTTVTGMIGYILKECGYDPVLMCGGGLKNYGASALTGKGDVFVTECDESDGTIALYNPDVAVLTNISVDHKSIEELRVLFGDFVNKSRVVVVNADNAEANKIIQNPHPNPLPQAGEGGILTFGFGDAAVTARDIFYMDEGASAIIQMGGKRAAISLEVPGAHNLSNALAAIAAVTACGVPLAAACDKLNRFTGIKRRMEWVGEAHGITVMDDFAHNPDKIAATLKALKLQDGRLHIIFQMHGYGPLKLLWQDLAATFATLLDDDDRVYMCDPLYLGGTVDKTIGIQKVVEAIGSKAVYYPTREECADAALAAADYGDRIIIMGARDDTLSVFAVGILEKLAAQ